MLIERSQHLGEFIRGLLIAVLLLDEEIDPQKSRDRASRIRNMVRSKSDDEIEKIRHSGLFMCVCGSTSDIYPVMFPVGIRGNGHHGGDFTKVPLSSMAYTIPRQVYGAIGTTCHIRPIGNLHWICIHGLLRMKRSCSGFSRKRFGPALASLFAEAI